MSLRPHREADSIRRATFILLIGGLVAAPLAVPSAAAACNEDDLRFMELGYATVGHRSYICDDGAGGETYRHETTYVKTEDTRVNIVHVDGVEVFAIRDYSQRGDHQTDSKWFTVLGFTVFGTQTESYRTSDGWFSRERVSVGPAAVITATQTEEQGVFSCVSHAAGVGMLYVVGVGGVVGFCENGVNRRVFSGVPLVGTAEVDWGRGGWTNVDAVRLHNSYPVPYHTGVESVGRCSMTAEAEAGGMDVSQPLGVHCGLT